jgi:hypothetical protein
MKFVQRAGVVAGAVAWMLAGCGGGEESTGSAAVRETAMALEAEAAAAGLTITGTAATGDALAGATVTAKCAGNGGGGTAVVNAKGKFSLKATGQLPCVLEVPVQTMGIKLHGALVKGRTANLTPLTELALARVAGGSAATLFDSFDAAAQAKLTAKNLSAALQALRDAFEDQVKLGGSDAFTASFAINDAHDRKLDDVMDTLTRARTTLPEVGRALAASGATPETVGTLLQPAAATCRGLRTGRYRVINPLATDEAGTLVKADAEALNVTVPGSTVPAALVNQGNCNFTLSPLPGTFGRLVLAPSGLGALAMPAVVGNTTINTGAMVIPEQKLPLSELAGTWNVLQYARAAGGQTLQSSIYTLKVTDKGVVTNPTICFGLMCSPGVPRSMRLRPHSKGGFTLDISGTQARVFAFKAADGHVSLAMNMPGIAGVAVATRQVTLPLPPVGTVSRFWDFSVNSNGSATPLASFEMTVTGTDAEAGSITRTRTGDNRIDTQVLNQPLPGLRYRNTNACSINGSPWKCDGSVTLALPGTGVAVYVGLAPANFLGVSINMPAAPAPTPTVPPAPV